LSGLTAEPSFSEEKAAKRLYFRDQPHHPAKPETVMRAET
jgi:hypothetical protein